MQNVADYIETNGASLTVDVQDVTFSGEEAKRDIEGLIVQMELEDRGVILSHSTSHARITVRVKGDPKKIQDLHDAISKNEKYVMARRISLAYKDEQK